MMVIRPRMKGNSLILNRVFNRRRRGGLGLGGSKRRSKLGRSGPDLGLGGPLMVLWRASVDGLELLIPLLLLLLLVELPRALLKETRRKGYVRGCMPIPLLGRAVRYGRGRGERRGRKLDDGARLRGRVSRGKGRGREDRNRGQDRCSGKEGASMAGIGQGQISTYLVEMRRGRDRCS